MKRILVTGAGGSAAINFISSLRMADESYFIVGGDINKWHLELPDIDKAYILPRCTQYDYIKKLNKVIRLENIEFVHPQPDIEVEVISTYQDEIDAKTFLPKHETILKCRDKMRTNQILRDGGVPVPESFLITRLQDIKDILDRLLKYSNRAWLRAIRGAGSRAALPIKTARQAIEWISYWRTMRMLESKDFMIAEYLPGSEFAFQSIWKDGKLITSQARERLEYVFGNLTPSGQSSSPSVAKTVHRNDVNEIATKAIKVIDKTASGIFCVDLKENTQGIPCITEINAGRFFTTSNFFAKAGSNMPHFYVKLAYRETLPNLPKYDPIPTGYYWIRLMDKGPVLVKEGEWICKEI